MSPRLVQLLHGWPRSHFSLRCLHGAHESGTRLRFLTTRNRWLSGDAPFEEVEEGGVGWIGEGMPRSVVVEDLTRLGSCAVQREAVANPSSRPCTIATSRAPSLCEARVSCGDLCEALFTVAGERPLRRKDQDFENGGRGQAEAVCNASALRASSRALSLNA